MFSASPNPALSTTPNHEKHGQLCRSDLCMDNYIPETEAANHAQKLKATMVSRSNPEKPMTPLMIAKAAHAISKAESSVDMMAATGLTHPQLPSCYDIELTEPKEITLKNATWKNKNQELAKSGRDASVFGSLGVLIVSHDIPSVDIPTMKATAVPKPFLERYGAELISLEQPVNIDKALDPSLEQLYLIEYHFNTEYVPEYAMKIEGGGGLFVETHPFPQIFTPLSKECTGAVILGRSVSENEYTFAAFEIPFGYTLKIAPNVIHGDSFFVGPYAIALNETPLADSVLIRKDTSDREIEPVRLRPIESVKLPLEKPNPSTSLDDQATLPFSFFKNTVSAPNSNDVSSSVQSACVNNLLV